MKPGDTGGRNLGERGSETVCVIKWEKEGKMITYRCICIQVRRTEVSLIIGFYVTTAGVFESTSLLVS